MIASSLKHIREPGHDVAGSAGDLVYVPYPVINLVATLLIGFKAWHAVSFEDVKSQTLTTQWFNRRYRRNTPVEDHDDNGGSRVQRVLLFSTESGLLYCLY